MEVRANYGWGSSVEAFVDADKRNIRQQLANAVREPSQAQIDSWDNSLKWLQSEYRLCLTSHASNTSDSTILEYELPRDFRRPDVVFLNNGAVLVIEVKGRIGSAQAALDQVNAYARDLRSYHAACAEAEVIPVLVPTDGPSVPLRVDDVWVTAPKSLALLVSMLDKKPNRPISLESFLQQDAYSPLPTIVQAARALFHKEELPAIKRARASTEPALAAISRIAHEAAQTKSRHLVLLSGVPGAGKTLVGLQLVHAGWLEDLSVERENGTYASPAVYLSGNGPLVEVLQDALKSDGKGGKIFVQGIKKYVDYYARRKDAVPPEHLIVFDEAQRAHDADRVATVHRTDVSKSEPQHMLEFCERVPQWSVFVALVGTGQAIHVGEEIGVPLWRDALASSDTFKDWTIHAPAHLSSDFAGLDNPKSWSDALNLDTEIRFHLTPLVHDFVEGLLESSSDTEVKALSDSIWNDGHRFLVTRSLEEAKKYLRERYEDAPQAKFGQLASSKDKWLESYGMDNSFQTTKRLKLGPWYNRDPSDPLSCCQLETVATEFSSQGLELDFALVGWGSDLLWENDAWSMAYSRGTRGKVYDLLQLRKNVYRVLLTRGRDGTMVYVPEDRRYDSTYSKLLNVGFREL
ncbi:MAG: DNA/RNA helicase domain-containing protein [Motiliproteus sp.]